MLDIQILVDNPNSWIIPYVLDLVKDLQRLNHKVVLRHSAKEVNEGDVLCLLACEQIFKDLHKNKYNLVVHESALPKGKGWSPVSWQVLEGKKRIPVTLFEADKKVDSGVIYNQKDIVLKGDELWPEIKQKQGEISIELILEFIDQYPNIIGVPQIGDESFYEKRTANSSKLNVNKSIQDQFDLLRICDNQRYPAFFEMDGIKYFFKIYK